MPRKFSDEIWKQFKSACNHYFDRFHALKNKAHKEEGLNLEKKEACMERLKSFELSGKRVEDISSVKAFIEEWKTIGRVPFNKKNIPITAQSAGGYKTQAKEKSSKLSSAT